MRAYQCDRCGKFYRSSKDTNEIYITGSRTSNIYIKDLCDKCQKELEAWWTKKKEKEAEDEVR